MCWPIRWVVFFVLIGWTETVLAQPYVLQGYVSNAQTREALIDAHVRFLNAPGGTTTNAYGYFSLRAPSDSVTLVISYLGCQSHYVPLTLPHPDPLYIFLEPQVGHLDTLEVVADRIEPEELPEMSAPQMSAHKISMKEVQILPALLGETDVLKAIQLMPGIQVGMEGTAGMYVRGGSHDQNLILLDGVPIYNVSHLFGFFSVFNPEAVNGVEMYKGGFPARYGGRIASVLDIYMREGNKKTFQGQAKSGWCLRVSLWRGLFAPKRVPSSSRPDEPTWT